MVKITLKNTEIGELFQAIKSLDGRPEVIKDHDGKIIGILQNKPYKLELDARHALKKTLRSIKSIVEDFEDLQKVIVNDPDKKDNEKEKELRELGKKMHEVEVHMLDDVKLNIDTNEISQSIWMALEPMLNPVIGKS